MFLQNRINFSFGRDFLAYDRDMKGKVRLENFSGFELWIGLISVMTFISEPQGDQDLHAHSPHAL